MGSKIHISSREGEGSMFFFTLPMRPGEDDVSETASTATQSAPAAPARRKTLRSLHILVVDDNAINQKVVTSFLSRLNHTADTADTAESALAIIQKKIYDLILMDIQLPGMPGDEATRILRKLPDPEKSSLPVIALTGNTRDEDIALYRRAGMDGFVAKPIDPDQLRDAIDQVMGADEAAATPEPSMEDNEGEPGWPTFKDGEPDQAPAADVSVFNAEMMDTLKVNLGREKLNDLLNELTVKTHELVGALEDAQQRRDHPQIRARAHEIKGMTGNFGLDELSQIAAHIERIARGEGTGIFDAAAPHIALLRPALARAESAMNAWMNA
jgi:CheY-like chemotaxis protein/HPt (histidine-containing phosphotransfer) domain-containing protein